MDLLPILLLTLLVAGFVQGATGFGFGLVAMSVLPLFLDVREAVPVVSVLGLLVCVIVLARWIRHLDGRKALPLLLGEAVGTPLGVLFLTWLDRRIVTATLGVVLVLYAGSRLAAERLPPTEGEPRPMPRRRWGVGAGLLGGVLGGAFNTGGPPLIVYATSRRWAPGAFRANLQAAFLFNTIVQLAMFAHAGLLTPAVLRLDLIGVPALFVGVGAGTFASQRLDAKGFRRVVLVALVVFGVVYLVRTVRG